MSDLGERTEDPTPRRREQTRQQGNVARSQELSAGILLLTATLTVWAALWPMLGRFKTVLENVLTDDALGNPIDSTDTFGVLAYVARAGAGAALPILLIAAAVAFLTTFGQIGWLFAPTVLLPRLSKLNPLSGFRRIFSLTGFFKAGIDIIKVALVLSIVALTVYQYRAKILELPFFTPPQILSKAAWMLLDLAFRLLAILLFLGLLDFLYQRWKHTQDLKMTKHEVKDEMKQSEGDPQVKKRRLRIQLQIAMQRVSAAVPKADVVVTNPEHVALAIQYDAAQMNAPKVIAKGADYLAIRIRQIALANGIPVVERPPLARALYRQVAVGQEIPPDFYNAVAEILAYVYGLRRKAG